MSITFKRSESEARETTKKRDVQRSVLKSEGGAGANFFSNFVCRCHFCEGMQLNINIFYVFFLCSKTTPCAENQLFSKTINMCTVRGMEGRVCVFGGGGGGSVRSLSNSAAIIPFCPILQNLLCCVVGAAA